MFYSQSIVQFIARRSHLILAQIFLLTVLFLYTGKSVDASPYPYLDTVPFDQQEVDPSTVWGTVWNDVNNNGNRERFEGIPEPLLAGAEVRLQNVYTGEEQTEMTNQDGEYSFQVHKGVYILEIEALGGISKEDFPIQVQPAITHTAQFTIYMEPNVPIAPIGLQAFGALGGRVWNDENFDGMQSDDEAGLSDISVELVLGDSVAQSVQSDIDGNYLFQNLPPAAYAIQITKPEQYRYSPQNSAIDDKHNSDIDPELNKTVLISDLFSFSIDIGLADIPMSTETPTVPPEYTTTPTITSTATVTATPTLTYTPTAPPATPTITSTATVTATPTLTYTGTPMPTETPMPTATPTPVSAKISGAVWVDQNRNGLWDGALEQLKPDIRISLYLEGQPNSAVHSTTTADNGSYAFNDLQPDSYYMRVGVPEAYELSPPHQADSMESRFELDGRTDAITLTSGAVMTGWNAGLMKMLPDMVPQITRVDYVTQTAPITVCGTGFLTDGGLVPTVTIKLEELLRPLSDSTTTVENIYEDGDMTCLEVRSSVDLPAGLYTVIVENANGESGTDKYSFIVLPPSDSEIAFPIITNFIPKQHRANQTSTIQFDGYRFQEGITLDIGGTVLTPTVRTGETYLEFVINANSLLPDSYHLILENPGEGPTSLPNAYTILQSNPFISSFRPDKIYQNSEVIIDIFGDSFSSDMTLYLQNEEISQTLPITYINDIYIKGVLSGNIPAGDYGFVIVDGDGTTTEIDGQIVMIYDDTPQILGISPDYGQSDVHNLVSVQGRNLITGSQVLVGGYTALEVDYLSDTLLQINIPSDALQPQPEKYDIQITNPNTGEVGRLPDAYMALAPNTKDIYARDEDLWISPPVPYVNEQVQVGLNVHLRGGQQRVNNVKVAFSINSSTGQATFIDEANIINLDPSGSAPTIRWTPSTNGIYTIVAVIDPEEKIEEDIEHNNVITQTFIVSQQKPDMDPPRIDQLMVNNITGTQFVTVTKLTMQISASDILVRGSESITDENGIASVYIQELKFGTSIRSWVPIHDSDWITYQHTMNMDWNLDDSSGLKALQVWASDWAGNVSLFPFQKIVNYEPVMSRIKQHENHIYRHEFTKGECVRLNMVTEFGDPDLYVWPPAELIGNPPWVNNRKDKEDSKIVFIAPIDGFYKVEVHGYVESNYRLDVTHEFEDSDCTPIDNKDPDIEELAAPASLELSPRVFVPPPPESKRSEPPLQDIPDLPVERYNVYLPHLRR